MTRIGSKEENHEDKGDEGVVGYGGKLDIRPAYQREFIYKDKQDCNRRKGAK